MPAMAFAGDSEELTYGSYRYTVSNGEAAITDYLGTSTNVTIPSAINGYPVTAAGGEAFCNSLGQ